MNEATARSTPSQQMPATYLPTAESSASHARLCERHQQAWTRQILKGRQQAREYVDDNPLSVMLGWPLARLDEEAAAAHPSEYDAKAADTTATNPENFAAISQQSRAQIASVSETPQQTNTHNCVSAFFEQNLQAIMAGAATSPGLPDDIRAILACADDYQSGRVSMRPLPPTVIPDFLACSSISLLYGAPKTGKSLVGLKTAHCVASGRDFFGRKLKQSYGVLYISAEGPAINAQRLFGMVSEHAVDEAVPIVHITACNLTTPDGQATLAALCRVHDRYYRQSGTRLGLVVIDTVAAGLSIEDENNNMMVSRSLKWIEDEVCRKYDAAGLLVHHSGKNEGAHARGATAFTASAAIVVLAKKLRARGQFALCVEQNRLGESDFLYGNYTIKARQIGTSSEGEPVVAPYIEMASAESMIEADFAEGLVTKEANKLAHNVGKLQYCLATLIDALQPDMLPESGDEPLRMVRGVPHERLINLFQLVGKVETAVEDPSGRRKAFNSAARRAIASEGSMMTKGKLCGAPSVWFTEAIGQSPAELAALSGLSKDECEAIRSASAQSPDLGLAA